MTISSISSLLSQTRAHSSLAWSYSFLSVKVIIVYLGKEMIWEENHLEFRARLTKHI